MKTMMRAFYARPLAVSLIVALLLLSSFAGPAEAMFVTAAPGETAQFGLLSSERAADLAAVEKTLESKLVRQKLIDYGLTPSEALARVNALSDKQLHELATHMDSLQAGGDPGDLFFGLLIVALLAVVLVYLVQGKIEVK